MKKADTRKNVLDALHMMGELKNVIKDTHGNVSQIEGDDVVYIKPSGMDYEKITINDICKVHLNRPRFENNTRIPSVDTKHHVDIYESCPWIGAICHTHSPYATAFAVTRQKNGLDCYTTEQADYFGGNIKCLPFVSLASWGEYAAKSLTEETKAVLLQNHGVLTFADCAKEAVKLAAVLENIAQKNYLICTLMNMQHACQDGDEFILSNAQQKLWHERYKNDYGQKNDPDSE